MLNSLSPKSIRKMLLIIGLWPEDHKLEKNFPFVRYRYCIPLSFVALLISVPQTANLFRVYNNLVLLTENLTVANFAALCTCWKIFIMKSNWKVLGQVVTSYAMDQKNMKGKKESEILRHSASVSGIFAIISVLLAEGTASLKTLERAVFIIQAEINGREREFFFQSWFPSIMKVTPNYQLVCAGQFLAVHFLSICYAAVDSFFFMLLLHICAQFKILQKTLFENINSSRNSQDDNEFKRTIGLIVRRHDHLNCLVRIMEDSFNFYLLILVIISTLLICFQAFLVFKEISKFDSFPVNEISFLASYVIYVLTFLFFYCYIGELVTTSSTEIRNAVFRSNWQNLSPRNSKMLMIIIFRTRRPLQLTAGKFSVFSIETYSKIIRTAAGYCSVIIQFYKG
ncbi:odorant receptor 67c-like [Prorops nasuta]|uniref:odorant receptor 67c-like n=1 Tax=Prorops nasuta TaxID=863751 RepID=UPI0034CF8613